MLAPFLHVGAAVAWLPHRSWASRPSQRRDRIARPSRATSMKTIGLVGGVSWESSAQYYRIINQEMRRRLGGHHSARLLLHSVDFAQIIEFQHRGDWAGVARTMSLAAQSLERGGADFFLLCSNTMHWVAGEVSAWAAIPMIHIVDVVGEAIAGAGIRRVGLLGTRFTMEENFYKRRLADKFGLEVLVPDAAGRRCVNDIIFEELIFGKTLPASRQAYREVIAGLVASGAEAVILGCTEIMLLVQQSDSAVPLFDSTTIHARAAVDLALGLSQPMRDVATAP